ncbi:SlyX family protein [Rubripirellula obstinata]|uniref:SlyX family protein n=1 Tax=Rubripirellula obstinata TaxID=406547 RepID=UPI00083647A6|nr:SlyX family protein [Rubripirellula obstinata]
MDDKQAQRITELEISLAHLQRLFDQLNEVVTSEAIRSDKMQRRISELEQQLKTSKEKPAEENRSLEDERPPHY